MRTPMHLPGLLFFLCFFFFFRLGPAGGGEREGVRIDAGT